MKKRNIKMLISYDGTKYRGWQRQKNSNETIQGKIENVLLRMTNEKIEIIGSGRTDAGVHAFSQIANFYTYDNKDLKEIKKYLNEYLPQDIAVSSVQEVRERFHSRYNVDTKTYRYSIWIKEESNVFERNYSYWVNEELDIEKMKEASKLFIGEKDFQGFASRKIKKSTVRDIKDIKFDLKDGMLRIYITADGFLYNMVRIIVGTLLEIGLGNRRIHSIKEVIETKDRSKAGGKAPAQGLVLYDVTYKENK